MGCGCSGLSATDTAESVHEAPRKNVIKYKIILLGDEGWFAGFVALSRCSCLIVLLCLDVQLSEKRLYCTNLSAKGTNMDITDETRRQHRETSTDPRMGLISKPSMLKVTTK